MCEAKTAGRRKWFVLALCATIIASSIIVPWVRQRVVWEARHHMKGSEEPEAVSWPGRFPGELHSPEGPYLEVQVVSLALLQTGEIEARFRLAPRNGLAPVAVERTLFAMLVGELKLWTEDGAAVGCRWHRILVDAGPPPYPTTKIEAAGTELSARSFHRVELVMGPAEQPLQPGKLRYIIDCRCDWRLYATGADEERVRVWGEGEVAFAKP